jgi:hypothetical protein
MGTQIFIIPEGVRYRFTPKLAYPRGVDVWTEDTRLVIRDADGMIGEIRGELPYIEQLLKPLGEDAGPRQERLVVLDDGDQIQVTTSINNLRFCVYLDLLEGSFDLVGGGPSFVARIEGRDIKRRLKRADCTQAPRWNRGWIP